MMDRKLVENELIQYCDSLNEDCPVVLLDAIALLKEQEAVEPVLEQDFMVCGECGHDVILQRMIGDMLLDERVLYCPACGRKVKWE